MYAKLTAATVVRIARQPPNRACQYAPIAIPRVNIPNLKRPVCHHFNVKALKIFMRRAFLRTETLTNSVQSYYRQADSELVGLQDKCPDHLGSTRHVRQAR
jgi:hypothetical protein